jgi:ABC-type branched-subunit amino acid transport system substrate-binding protein
MKSKFLLIFLSLFLTALLFSGCAEVRDERPSSEIKTQVPAPEKVSPWRAEADRLERLGDYDGALRVVERAYVEQPSDAAADRFSLLLSRLSEGGLDSWWRQEQDESLKCRVAAEYFSRLSAKPESELNFSRSFLLRELARRLVSCPVSEDIRAQARELLEREAAAAGPEITIGCLLPLSGPNARAGAYLLRGMELALGVYPVTKAASVTNPETSSETADPGSVPGTAEAGSAADNQVPTASEKPAVEPQKPAAGLSAATVAGENRSEPGLEPENPASTAAVYASPEPARVRIRLLVYDTAGEGEKARAGVDYLVREKQVSLIIGPYTGKAANYAAVEAQSLGVTMISLSPLLHDPERYDRVFLHYPTIRNQADCLARLAMLRLGLEKFALLVPRNRYGREFAVDFTGRVQAWGGKVVRQVYYDAAQPDYGPAIRTLIGPERYRRYKARRREYEEWFKEKQRRQKADAAGEVAEKPARLLELAREIGIADDELKLGEDEIQPRPLLTCDFDAVVIPDRAQTLKLLLPQLAFYDLDEVFLLGGRYWNSDKLIKEAGEYARGALLVDAYSRTPGVSRSLDEFLDDYRALWPEGRPTLLDVLGYDTVKLVGRLYAEAGPNPDAESWRRALAGCRNLQLASGLTSARPGGELAKQLYPLTFGRQRIEKFQGLCQP